MDILLANTNHLDLKIESDLIHQVGAIPLPFHGMDKSMAAVCQFINSNNELECDKGSACPYRHIRGDRTIVCKHWLRGLCKKGDQCEFLHEYDMKKMPECYFYSRFNACHNKECPFLHIDPESKVKDCPWYDRGFCRHGPHCRHRHVRRVMCMNYLAGFCPNGGFCKFMHPRFELPPVVDNTKDQSVKRIPICHNCGEFGHKATVCKKPPQDVPHGGMNDNMNYHRFKPHFEKQYGHENRPGSGGGGGGNNLHGQQTNNGDVVGDNKNNGDENGGGLQQQQQHQPPYQKIPKPLEEITCYKCGHKGHYANKCPKGHLAFLSNQRSHK